MSNVTANTTYIVTDTIGTSGTLVVTQDTTSDEFANWYLGDVQWYNATDADVESTRDKLDAALNVIQMGLSHRIDGLILDFLGLTVEENA